MNLGKDPVRSAGAANRGDASGLFASAPEIGALAARIQSCNPGVRLDRHGLTTDLWREHRLTILMVTHDIKEAFKLGGRVLAFDKRRHDPHAPHRYGSTAVYDFPLENKARA